MGLGVHLYLATVPDMTRGCLLFLHTGHVFICLTTHDMSDAYAPSITVPVPAVCPDLLSMLLHLALALGS